MTEPDETYREYWKQKQEQEASKKATTTPPLKHGGGGGTFGGMDVVDAKIAASEARTDAKFQAVLGKLDRISDALSRIDGDMQRTRTTVRTTGFTLAALIIAIAGFIMLGLTNSFNAGTRIRDLAREEAQAAVASQKTPPVATPSPVAAPPAK